MHGVVCVFCLDVGFVCCQCVGWISGLDVCLGLAGQSCGLQMFGSCLLASCVGAGQGCVHVWFGVCVFPYRLALCLANVLVGCLVCWLCV